MFTFVRCAVRDITSHSIHSFTRADLALKNCDFSRNLCFKILARKRTNLSVRHLLCPLGFLSLFCCTYTFFVKEKEETLFFFYFGTYVLSVAADRGMIMHSKLQMM